MAAMMKTTVGEIQEKAVVVFRNIKTKAEETKDKTMVLCRDPQFQTCTVATAGGAITFGTVGGTFGLASGVVLGSAAGVVPALFTFGLSIPVGGAMGGIGGLCAGTLVGSSAGGVGGFTTYKYRVEIKDGMMIVKVKAQDTLKITKEKTMMALNGTKSKIGAQVCKFQVAVSTIVSRAKTNSLVAVDFSKAKASKAAGFSKGKASEAVTFATTTKVGVTSSSAVAGAVVGGTTTGAFGTVAGAAAGLPLALFTFGLSIPVGAAVGLCVGTTVGGSAGAVGGGAIGYGGFTHRKVLSEGIHSSWGKVSGKADQLKIAAFACAGQAQESMRPRSHSTGGSDIKTD